MSSGYDDDDEGGGLQSAMNHHLYLILVTLGWIAAMLAVITLLSILTYCHSH